MRALIAGALFALGLTVPGAADADEPVVIELFTSQGCSSCPPADAMILELAKRDDVIPLALHVDYWDYLGWKDEFADPAFSARQSAYVARVGKRRYTPHMVVGGVDHVGGFKPMRLAEMIEAHADVPAPVALEVTRSGDLVRLRAEAERPLDAMVLVHLVRYLPEATVKIRRGENAGRTFTYHNIVRQISDLGGWDGRGTYSVEFRLEAEGPHAVLMQQTGQGPIVAAARLP